MNSLHQDVKTVQHTLIGKKQQWETRNQFSGYVVSEEKQRCVVLFDPISTLFNVIDCSMKAENGKCMQHIADSFFLFSGKIMT